LRFHQVLAIQLTLGLVFPLFSQTPPKAESSRPPRNQTLKIFVLQGEGAINDIRTGASTFPVVEVRDKDDRPMEGATVTFELPSSGPSALFPNGKLTLTARTNSQGQAGATGFLANDFPGQFKIKVTASIGSQSGTVSITQTNSTKQFAMDTPKRKGISKKWWIIAGIAVAGGVAGGLLATRGGSTAAATTTMSTAPAPVSIIVVPGPIAIGGPK
jgi:hypothetical protein